MSELPTIKLVTAQAVTLNGQTRLVATESEAKEVAFEMGLLEWVKNIVDARKTGTGGIPATGDKSIITLKELMDNRHSLLPVCKLLNGGNVVSVTAPAREPPLEMPAVAEPVPVPAVT